MQVSDHFAKIIQRCALAFALVLGFFLVVQMETSRPVHAQNAGTVGIQAVMTPVFSSASALAHSAIFQDIGQGTNLLFYCNSGFSGTIDLEWNPSPTTGTTYLVIAQASWVLDSNCHALPFGSYFPNMRATVSPTAGNLSAWYTSISGPTSYAAAGLSTSGPTVPVLCDQTANTSVATGTGNAVIGPLNTGDVVVVCGVTESFSAAPTGGTLITRFYATTGCSTGPNNELTQTITASTPQTLAIPLYQFHSSVSTSQELCIANTSGVTVNVTVSYASVHGL